ncbi:uncharacterized protein LOC142579557 [Dermacentor variabilis]|uniref:uncharacterized protein LOC142579557 n=1 Tax=Dermacentor variabilis TaxID=34621 RepID=UPI003F5C0D89
MYKLGRVGDSISTCLHSTKDEDLKEEYNTGSGSSTSPTTTEHDKSQQRCRLRCDFCDYETGELLCLKAHVRLHTTAGPLLCHLCPQSFSRRDTFKKHLRIHTASRHFSCPVTNEGGQSHQGCLHHSHHCDYEAEYPSKQKLYLRVHTGERLFQRHLRPQCFT